MNGLFACKQKPFYESSIEIPGSVWESNKAATFKFSVTDTLQMYDISIMLSNSNSYRNSNIWLFVRTHTLNNTVANDTLEYTLANEKGKWLGDKDSDMWYNSLVYKSKIRFPQKGDYTIEIMQGMRDLKLKGINQVGLKINKAKL